MDELVLTYLYFRLEAINGTNIKMPDPKRYMESIHIIEENGYFPHITYCGQLFGTCGGIEEANVRYGFTILADKKTTMEIMNLIDYDASESFIYKTMEKVNKNENFRTLQEIADEAWTITGKK